MSLYAVVVTCFCVDIIEILWCGEKSKGAMTWDLPSCHVPEERGGRGKGKEYPHDWISPIPLECHWFKKFFYPAWFCLASQSLAKRTVSFKRYVVSMVLTFFRFLFTLRITSPGRFGPFSPFISEVYQLSCQRFAMASKKNAKVHVKSKGALLVLFFILSWVAVEGIICCSLQLLLSGLSKLIGCQAVISFRLLVLASYLNLALENGVNMLAAPCRWAGLAVLKVRLWSI